MTRCQISYPEGGRFSILDVSSWDEAVASAARIAVACRCAQEVRELMDELES